MPRSVPGRDVERSTSSNDDSNFWWIVAAVAGCGGGAFVLYRWWRGRTRTFHVRIIAIPPGEVPETVRRAWLGLELPLAPGGDGSPRTLPAAGVLSNEAGASAVGYAVDGRSAIKLLELHDSAAAAWWRENVPQVSTAGYQLGFPAEVCERTDRV